MHFVHFLTGEPSAPKRIIEHMDIDTSVPVAVTRIGAGGNQSFALVNPSSKKIIPSDYRTDFLPEKYLSLLTPEIIDKMKSAGADESLDQDFLEQLEIIFQNPACLNASFLLPDHKPCTSKNPGVDIQRWTQTTQDLTAVSNWLLCIFSRFSCLVVIVGKAILFRHVTRIYFYFVIFLLY